MSNNNRKNDRQFRDDKEAVKDHNNEAVVLDESDINVEGITKEESEPIVEDTPDHVLVHGVVNCDRLNIRCNPNIHSNVRCTVKAGTELMINKESSTDRWYSVCTSAGVEGFCMKDYIKVDI